MPAEKRSIGQVLAMLKNDFPDITISKIRFLEGEGLVSPERAKSGYRRYTETDVERLRYILTVQKDHYLPLKVIREHLDMMDRGMEPPALETPRPRLAAAPAERPAPADTEADPSPRPAAQRRPQLRLSREELLEASGLSEPALIELEKQMLVLPRRGTNHYGREAVTVAVAARKLAEFGIDARHLRAFKMAAEREVGVIEQAIAPHQRRMGGSRQAAHEVANIVIHVHAALMRTAMDR
ncbi:transcriptional regulator FtsR [Naumannella cuiyingiana]|uniref:DNA-binding transcriptional MerR regulator n=1 Tax=Naumannella cuiyingiana TaxID=1347891 RepID=A0A7Z0DBM9_9ACTN|nr:MerR family transcriptional regulator [Naumannella cuiyingiana]NYI72644.1 DNA-binding transcriptional MerR regulator [Naumannella cuiyingiana]